MLNKFKMKRRLYKQIEQCDMALLECDVALDSDEVALLIETKMNLMDMLRDLDSAKTDKSTKRIEIGINAATSILGVVLPLICYDKWLDKGYTFETENIITSTTFKNFLNKIRPN